MSAEREAGLAALQKGNPAEAVPYLERAVGAAPDDFQALLQLGAAYGQTGRHPEAVRTVMQAVTLQPLSPAARYSLAVAYANAGHLEYALTAAQQALQLQPGESRALELVARLSGTPTVSAGPLPSAMPYAQTAPNAAEQPSAPTAYGQPYASAPALYGQVQPTVGPMVPPMHTQAGGYETSRAAPPPYGAPVSAQAPPQVAAGSYYGQGAAAYGGSPIAAYYNPASRPGTSQIPDAFDLKQAVRDWVRVIREPNAFFAEQAEREGYNAPIAFLVALGIAGGVFTLISALIRLAVEPFSAGSAAAQGLGVVLGFAFGITGALMGAFVWGAVLHIVGRLFGNRQLYQKTFRVAAYSRAPVLFFGAISAIIIPFVLPTNLFSPSAPGSPSPFGQVTPVQFTQPTNPFGLPGRRTSSSAGGMTRTHRSTSGPVNPFDSPILQKMFRAYAILAPIMLIGMIWEFCLQAIGLRYAQKLSSSSAAGTVFLAIVLPFVLAIAVGVVFVLLLGVVFSSSRGGSPGMENLLSMIRPSLVVWHG